MKAPNGHAPALRPDVRLYLFHGADEAGAAELAKQLAATMAQAERVDLDGAQLRKEPGRLADEAASVSLFGEARLIRAQPIGEESLEALQLLLEVVHADAPVIALAPTVRTTARIVKLANDHPRALAIACYPPSEEQLERLVAAMLTSHGLRPEHGVAQRLAEAAGGDRAVITREVEKLALFLDAAPDRPRDAGLADLHAIGADLGDAEQPEAVAALVEGQPGALGAALLRLDEGGASAIPWLRAINRRLIALAEMQLELAGAASLDSLFAKNRIFDREERRRTSEALRRWSPAMLAEVLERLRSAERLVTTTANAGPVLAEHAAVGIATALDRRR